MTAPYVFWLFAAIPPAAVSTSSAGRLEVAEAVPVKESSFERAFRRRLFSSPVPPPSSAPEVRSEVSEAADGNTTEAPDPLVAAETLSLATEFRPSVLPPRDPDEEMHEIPLHPALQDRFFLGVGAFFATSNTEARLDSNSGIGTTVDFEDLLGLESSAICPQGLARWRMSERWRLELEYFQLNRSNETQITGEIVWGDETFPVNTTINTTFDISVLRLSCGYSFFKRPDKEIGVALGFHLTDIEAKLSSSGANADDGTLLAPLPVISLYGQFALTEIWAISGRLDAFRLEYDPYAGHIYSLGIDALCQPWRHVGFGFGWRGLDIEASADNGDFEGRVASNYQGPIAFISVSF